MPLPYRTRVAAIAATVATALAVSAPALAASKPKPVAKPKPAAVKVQRFTTQGLVVAATDSSLRVITRQLKVGGSSLPANTVVTVKRPKARSKTAAASHLVGYAVTLTGSAVQAGKVLTLSADQETVAPRPAQVFLGVVTAVSESGLQLDGAAAAGGDDFGAQAHALNVDVSAATNTVDGVAGTAVVGEFAIVVGERDQDTVVAASVTGYTSAPDVQAGQITDVSGSVVTLGDGWGNDAQVHASAHVSNEWHHGSDSSGGDNGGGDQPPASEQPADQPVTVDLAPAGVAVPIILNGSGTVEPSALTTGERIVVLGTSNETFVPTIAFAFNGHDHRPAGQNDD